MKSLKNAFTICIIFALNSVLAGQVSKTIISDIKIDNVRMSKLASSDVTIKPSQSISFYFSQTFPDDAEGEVFYKVFLNNKLLVSKLASNFVILHSLSPGDYIINVQALKGENFEAVAVNKTFTVLSSGEVIESLSTTTSTGISYVTIGLGGLSLLLLVAVILLMRKRKPEPVREAIAPEPEPIQIEQEPLVEEDPPLVEAEVVEIIHDPNAMSEFEELQMAHEKLKQRFKDMEDDNEDLRRSIKYLNKTIQSLEEANVNLIEQKESLSEKKLTLEELQNQKDELLAIKFHDLKNPAQAIQGLVSLLESYDLTAMEQHEIMESIVASSSNIVNLVQTITETFAKQNFDDKYHLEMASLQDVITSVVKINIAYAKKKQIRLLDNSSKSMPRFEFDSNKIKEVLDNLINNAIKFSPPKTDVTVRSYLTDTDAVTEVKDNGVGMTEDDLSVIFQKGVKLSAKPTGGEKSSGLGLWIAKKIVEAHKGTITVESKKGIGTKFVFKLPIK